MIYTILFDLDGVLVDACDLHFEAFNDALKKNGIRPLGYKEHLHSYNGRPTKTKLKMLGIDDPHLVDKISKEKAKLTVEWAVKIIKPCVDTLRLFEWLEEFEKKELLNHAIVTNSTKSGTYALLEAIGFTPKKIMNMNIITNEDVRFPKPSPEPYIKAMVMCQSFPEQTLIYEDSPLGIQAARASTAHVVECDNKHEFTPLTVEKVKKDLEIFSL